MQNMFLVCLLATILCTVGCNNKELCGPCFLAMHYRQEAEKTIPAMDKAALLGKADAAQRDCDAYNRLLQDQQKHGAKLRQR